MFKKGDRKRITVKPEEGYGSVDPNAFENIPKKTVPNWKDIKIGMIITGKKGGQPIQARVIGMDKKNFILDMNHPLAGKILQFDIQVVDVKPAVKN